MRRLRAWADSAVIASNSRRPLVVAVMCLQLVCLSDATLRAWRLAALDQLGVATLHGAWNENRCPGIAFLDASTRPDCWRPTNAEAVDETATRRTSQAGTGNPSYLGVVAALLAAHPIEAVDRAERLARDGVRPELTSLFGSLGATRLGQIDRGRALVRMCSVAGCELALERLGVVDAAELATDLSPGSSQAHFVLGAALRGQGRLREAESAFAWALRLDSRPLGAGTGAIEEGQRYTRAECLYRMGETALAAGDLPRARHDLEAALKEEPGHYWAPLQLALLDERTPGLRPSALRILESLVERYPRHVAAMVHLARLNREDGRLSVGRHWAQRALDVMPEYGPALAELAALGAR
jgi:tetratricopeptide (TPR) repeat protein